MDRKQMCVANVRYKRPTADEAKRMKNLLGYLTYRDSRDQGAKMVVGQDRWVDRGLGKSVADIAHRCDDLRSKHVLAFSLVINPNPQLTAMIAAHRREQFVRELTEKTVADFFEARGLDTGCEMSYVLHHRLSDDPQAPGLTDPHTHVVLPGTVFSEEHGERVPLYFSQNKKVDHIAMLHAATEKNMAHLLERYIGPDWEQRFDHLEAVREQQRRIVEQPPHGKMPHEKDAETEWNVWCGVRRTDERHTALGYYRGYSVPTEDDPDAVRLEFRPLVSGLRHDEADVLARYFARTMNGDARMLHALAEQLKALRAGERAGLVAELREHGWDRPTTRSPEISFDIDF
ncbi:MAG: hypothetical protein IT323_12660 [Anaerolineae bacterium]|nr:hypothetical protein [Anaerolineae bacterium]